VARIADVGHKAPPGSSRPLCCQFWHGNGQFSAGKITLVTINNNLNNDVKKNLFLFFEFLEASNTMVANEVGILR
jgi:hypothetical protein